MADTADVIVTDVHVLVDAARILRGVTLQVRRGEIFGVLGANGAGKSTLLNCIAGLRTPTVGTVAVLGCNPARDRSTITRAVGVQLQRTALMEELSVLESLDLFASLYPEARPPGVVLGDIGLDAAAYKRVSMLSGGERRRLSFGIAAIADPRLLVLDEPTAGVDPGARRKLWALMERRRTAGTTTILSTHDLSEAGELCDRIAILSEGEVIALGTPQELNRRAAVHSSIRFTVARADLSVPVVAAIREHAPGAEAVSPAGGGTPYFVIPTAHPDRLIADLTFDLRIPATRFHVRRGTLDDLFHSEFGG